MPRKKKLRPSRQSYAQRQVAIGCVVPDAGDAKPSEPTQTVPGSAERVAVMAERCSRGEPLFGADDLEHRPSSYELTSKRDGMLNHPRVI